MNMTEITGISIYYCANSQSPVRSSYGTRSEQHCFGFGCRRQQKRHAAAPPPAGVRRRNGKKEAETGGSG